MPDPAPIVGREVELERLEEVLDAIDAGGSGARAVVIEGEPGIGKTRLLAELRRRADARGHLVLGAAASEFERDLPFGIWIEALDAYVMAEAPGIRTAAWPDMAADCAAVLPSLAGPDRHALADERYRTHRAVRRLLEVLAAEKPLVLVLDDLHWIDAASDELLAALARRPPQAPVLVALGVRAGRAPPNLVSALAMGSTTILELTPLSEEECAHVAGDHVGPQLLGDVFRESGGNPFYLLELARSARRPAVRPPDARTRSPSSVPSIVAASLVDELRELPPDARALVEAAAVAGDPFEPEIAFAVAELDDDRGTDALDDLIATGLVHPTDVPRRFGFRHPLVRRAVYDSTRAGRRSRAHARAATTLARLGAPAAARANHVEQSAATGDGEAIELLVEAGDTSAPRDPSGAIHWYDAALRLIPPGDGERRLDALVRRAGALRAIGRVEECRATLLEAVALVPPADGALRVRMTAAAAFCEHMLGRHQSAQRRLDEALRDLPDPGSRDAAVVLTSLAAGAFFTRDLDRMRETAGRALDAARRLGDPALAGAAAAQLTHSYTLAGRTAEASQALAEANRLLDALPDEGLAQHLEAVNTVGWTELYLERFADSIAHLERGLAVSRRYAQGAFVPFMNCALALSATMCGDRARARAARENAIDAARLTANQYVNATALMVDTWIGLMLWDDVEAVLRTARHSVALSRDVDSGAISGMAAASCAVAEAAAGAAGDAGDALEREGGWDLPHVSVTARAWYLGAMAELAAAAGDAGRAERFAARVDAVSRNVDLCVPAAVSLRAHAAVLRAAGDATGSARLAQEAAKMADSVGARIEAARATALAGAAMAQAGDRDAGVAALRAAERELDACGAVGRRDAARRDLRRLGARAEAHGPAAKGEGLASLSRREREVAELVTDRRTNREIADRLFLSEKTVETHLRNIFFKLGASKRVDVARAVEARRQATGASARGDGSVARDTG